MTLHSASESFGFCWKSSTKDISSSERLDEGARPVFSGQLVLTIDGIQHFVPEYIREKFHGRIEPNQCTIKAICKAEEKDIFYFIYDAKFSSLPLQYREHNPPLLCLQKHREQTRYCDGPCGKKRSVKELQVHGRCEHAICQLCNINAPMIENNDGSTGCCNLECFATDLATLCPDPILRHKYFQMIIKKHKINETTSTCQGRKGRNIKQPQQAMESLSSSQTLSVSKSRNDKRGLKKPMCIKVLVLEKGPMETICRRRTISEIDSIKSLRNTLQFAVGDGSNLRKSSIFFNYDGNAGNSKLQKIDLKHYGDKKISYFPSSNGTLNFVIDYTNFIEGNSISPYI
ncbi:unnamed protein product [Onchocerca ochengi]|uniref:DM domain-containing protein n=1 Tax=Onchocerca ochengi TaxID=42157 RepID=A0A182EIC3_ONCOC|nr:unnamed protein product [Onchocerca ochengi]